MPAKPDWLKIRPPSSAAYAQLQTLVRQKSLHTVCEEAHCPNQSECWSGGTATFMILGDSCTRGCKFCHVKTARNPQALDLEEPQKLAQAIQDMKLNYAVITSVDRDDLADQGAGHWRKCIEEVKRKNPSILVETLTPDFRGSFECVKEVIDSGINVFAHNIETVPRLQSHIRDPRANYAQSLSVLRLAKAYKPLLYTKSSIMLGLGEREEEVLQTFHDLRNAGVDIVTLGQYLQPSSNHLPVFEYVSPEKFEWFKEKALEAGFLYCASGPFVRSSYRAGEFFLQNKVKENA